MRRYIDADLIEYEPMCRARGNGMYEDCEIAYKDQIDDIPTADVRENVHGEWLDCEVVHDRKDAKITDWQQARCSVCGRWHTTPYMYYFDHYNFCPVCGADMRGDKT